MSTHLVTFSDESMSRARDLCYLSARQHGIQRAHVCNFDSVRRLPCYQEHQKIFDSPRGAGYWAWKPALLNQIMTEDAFVQDVREGDVIVYADAGVEFINNVSYIIDRMDQDIFLFGNNWEHVHWCKADVLYRVAVEPADDMRWMSWDRYGKQCQASVIFFRVSDYSRSFVAEWLKWCLWHNGTLIDDSPSGILNHPEFREHRHDQAILTTLAYREGIRLHWWPAVYNRGGSPEFVYEKLPEYAGDDYPILFHHHRRRNHEWEAAA